MQKGGNANTLFSYTLFAECSAQSVRTAVQIVHSALCISHRAVRTEQSAVRTMHCAVCGPPVHCLGRSLGRSILWAPFHLPGEPTWPDAANLASSPTLHTSWESKTLARDANPEGQARRRRRAHDDKLTLGRPGSSPSRRLAGLWRSVREGGAPVVIIQFETRGGKHGPPSNYHARPALSSETRRRACQFGRVSSEFGLLGEEKAPGGGLGAVRKGRAKSWAAKQLLGGRPAGRAPGQHDEWALCTK